ATQSHLINSNIRSFRLPCDRRSIPPTPVARPLPKQTDPRMRLPIFLITALLVVGAAAGPTFAQEAAPAASTLERSFRGKAYSPYANRSFATNVYWGDTHLHTSYSFDAGAFGARLDPTDAYKFARGEQVTSSTGQPVKLARPLDFLVVADHSDNMGFFPDLFAGKPELLADPIGRDWYDRIQLGGQDAVGVALELISKFSQLTFPETMMYLPDSRPYRAAWEKTIDAAEKANTPGVFTAFIGYEWTSNTGGNNLHRVIIYRDDESKASQTVPLTTYPPQGTDNPRDLWTWLEDYEKKTGGDVLAIAHNGNLSNGIMFPEIESFTGKPIDAEYAEKRAKWERLYEVTQIKGDGEAHPFLSPNDEFADYETWDVGNLDLSVVKTNDMLQNEYARSALKIGLKAESQLGTNPYKFGLIGSTDSHTGLATADDDNFFGKHAGAEPEAGRMTHEFMRNGDAVLYGWQQVASGYAAVWAQENTRKSIFDAMERKETYATTGPRMLVRFFGGWDFDDSDANSRSPGEIGYRKGVPMGGDLRAGGAGDAPSFLVAALKDPIGANLDRVQ
ncbi:MAG: DUF3604 domain-containing protein, partial [Pirellulaceae bacterium]